MIFQSAAEPLAGKNGEADQGIHISNGIRIGYFSQELDTLDVGKTVLENVMGKSVQPEWAARTILARLLIRRDDVFKKAAVLSGGERVKVSIAGMLVSDANLLLLDEPTNYLDLPSMEALQSLLTDYPGTVIFVSHDRRFINAVADRVVLIENSRAVTFEGNLEQYARWKGERREADGSNKEQELLLRMRMAEIAARLSMPSKNENTEILDREFRELAARLKEFG